MKLILGAAQLGLSYGINNKEGMPTLEKSLEILQYAYNAGITTVDTADAYGEANDILCEFHKSGRLFNVINKFNITDNSDKAAEKKLFSSLKKLNLSRLDCYMYHSYNQIFNQHYSSQLLLLKEKGYFNKIGVSVYSNEELKQASEIDWLDVIQVPFNLLDNYSKKGPLLEYAKYKGKEINIRSIYLQGLFLMNQNSFPQKLMPLKKYLLTLNKIAKNHNTSIKQIALTYPFYFKNIDKILIGTESLSQLMENIEIVNSSISTDIVNEINSISVVEDELLYPQNWQ